MYECYLQAAQVAAPPPPPAAAAFACSAQHVLQCLYSLNSCCLAKQHGWQQHHLHEEQVHHKPQACMHQLPAAAAGGVLLMAGVVGKVVLHPHSCCRCVVCGGSFHQQLQLLQLCTPCCCCWPGTRWAGRESGPQHSCLGTICCCSCRVEIRISAGCAASSSAATGAEAGDAAADWSCW